MIKGGTTVLFVSHSLKQIEELCQRVIWLDHGKVRMIGESKEVCKKYYEEEMGEKLKNE